MNVSQASVASVRLLSSKLGRAGLCAPRSVAPGISVCLAGFLTCLRSTPSLQACSCQSSCPGFQSIHLCSPHCLGSLLQRYCGLKGRFPGQRPLEELNEEQRRLLGTWKHWPRRLGELQHCSDEDVSVGGEGCPAATHPASHSEGHGQAKSPTFCACPRQRLGKGQPAWRVLCGNTPGGSE